MKISQRAMFVEVNWWYGLLGFFALHMPFSGGGPSPGFSPLGTIPAEFWRKVDFSITRLPPEFEPE